MQQKAKIPSLNELRWVHIIGVGGTLMGAFAAYLKRRGMRVTGSDGVIYPPMSDVLKAAQVELFNGYRPENLIAGGGRPDLVVIGNVVGAVNPEARAAIDGDYVYSSLPEAMEQLFLGETRNLVVAGTHGKTTTSCLLAHVLKVCQKDPNYFIGGVSHDLPFSFHITDLHPGHPFVLEGDEYDTAFWDKVPKFNHYLPQDVILTSVEYDHADIYPDLAAVIRAFEGLMTRVQSKGRVIACYDYPVIRDLVKKVSVPVLSYGSTAESGAQFHLGNVRVGAEFTQFEILDRGATGDSPLRKNPVCIDDPAIQIPGKHNALNALAVWLECRELGLDAELVRQAFRSFRGVKRRQEVRGEVSGVMVIDDFAHHPTAVRETLKSLRSKYPDRRLVTLFEPRSATSRRKIFQKDYVTAFQEADVLWIATPFDQSRIDKSEQFSSETLVQDLKNLGKMAFLMDSVETGVEAVAQMSRPGDLVAVLSNGGFGGFIQKFLDRLNRQKDLSVSPVPSN